MNAVTNVTDEAQIRELIERWAEAVRAKDYDKILKDHAPDILMFDVPPPIQSKGTEEYKKTWDLFFSASPTPPIFDIKKLDITAGIDVAFATALMQCVVVEKSGDKYDLDFRLTVGLRKIDGRWTIVHEHHSIPAE